jgi:DegV family protein with EDD domain
LVVLAAAKAAAMGKRLDEVAEYAQRVRQVAGGLMLLDTLRYAYRTGRISKAASQIASLLNIKPINKLTADGKVEFVDRVRKKSDGLERILNMIEREMATKALHFMVTHAAVLDEAKSFAQQLKERFQCLSMVIGEFSPVMGYGAGPGVIFVGFHPEVAI